MSNFGATFTSRQVNKLVFGTHGLGQQVPASSVNYCSPFISGLLVAASSISIPLSGKIIGFYFRMASAQPASGNLILQVAHSPTFPPVVTPVAITIPAGTAPGTYFNIINETDYIAGNLINFFITNNALSPSGGIGSLTFVLYN